MDWLKLTTDYYRDLAGVSDAAEVMFVRSLAYAVEQDTGGLLPNATLHWFARSHRTVLASCEELVSAGLWKSVADGFEIVDWAMYARPRRRRWIPDRVRARVYRRDGGRCLQCGSTADLSLDHIVPWSMGGADTASNLQTFCLPCNQRKGATVL